MRVSIKQLRSTIHECINEINGPSGGLRRVRGSGGQQHRLGKIEDENRELSFSEAEMLYPGSTNAWAEIVPEMFPEFPFHEPSVIKKRSLFFKIGDKLTVAFADQPQIELATWDAVRDDWFENSFT